MKTALITGVTGQDGSYLTELLLDKGYNVYGLRRRSSSPNTQRIDHLIDSPVNLPFESYYMDLTDSSSINRLFVKLEPDEIYNLGSQSHVGISFQIPEYSVNVTGLGALRLLDAIRDMRANTRFYQASSSEMFGNTNIVPQNESTPFNPHSPYAAAKVFAYHMTCIYRASYRMFCANGILFNHESPRRDVNFVMRKITLGLSRIKTGRQKVLRLGNLDVKRDWGYAKDYVAGIWAILQHSKADDFVLATGENHSVREVVEVAGRCLGFKIVWQGGRRKEKGIDAKTGKTVVVTDSTYIRPNEVYQLKGDSMKARKLLAWNPKTTFTKLIDIMVRSDYDALRKEKQG